MDSENLFFWRELARRKAVILCPLSCLTRPLARPENLSVSDGSRRFSEHLLSLDEKEHRIGWWGASDRFHPAYTVRTERIEPHTVLPGNEVLLQFGA